ncbi:hypothetical protein BDV10DRAFT_162040 [Aspergillus recurvatus]
MYDHGKTNETLHLASQAGHEDLARMLLQQNGFDIDIDHILDSKPNEGAPLC